MRKIDTIILHCSATQEGSNFTVSDIDKWHRARGFKMIGYHYVIYLDGSVHAGRSEEQIGAHCQGMNSSSIGICYIGGLDKKGKPKDTRTQAQKDSLIDLVYLLLQKYNLNINDVYCHYEFNSDKACPCFRIEDFKKEYLDAVKNKEDRTK